MYLLTLSNGGGTAPGRATHGSLGQMGLAALVCANVVLGVSLHQLWVRPGRTRSVLERRRTHRAERMFAPVRDHKAEAAAPGDLRRDWSLRIRATKLQSILEGLFATQAAIPIGFTSAMCAVAFASMIVPHLLRLPGFPVPHLALLPFISPVMIWALILMSLQIPRRVRKRARNAIDHQACPDCGYDLRNLSGPDTPHPVGPAACPECGVRWPLVPPAIIGQA